MNSMRDLLAIMSMLLLFYVAGQAESYELLNYPMGTQSFAMGGVKSSDPCLADETNVNSALIIFIDNFTLSSYGLHHLAGISGFSGKAVLPMESHYFSGEILLMNYGIFDLKDEYGNSDGTFGFYELVANAGYAYEISSKLGVGTKLISYQRRADNNIKNTSFVSMGAIYHTSDDSLTIGFSVDNYPISELNDPSPLSVRAGLSKKLAHLPLRINVDGIYEKMGAYHFELGGNIDIAKNIIIHVGLTSDRFNYQTGIAKSDVFAGVSLGATYMLKQTQLHWGVKSYASMGAVTQAGISYSF